MLGWKDLAAKLPGEPTEVGEALGVVLDEATAEALIALPLDLDKILAFVDAVIRTGFQVGREKVVGRGKTWVHMLGIRRRDAERELVTVGFRTGFGSSVITTAWPQLGGWSRSEDANRPIAERWAEGSSDDRVTLEVSRPAEKLDDDARLRVAIAANPDDVAARQVYADWLIERGRPLGELIRLSLEPGDHKKELKALEDRAWNELGDIARYTTRFQFKGGFVTSVRMSVPAFEKHGAAFFASHPIRTLELEWESLSASQLERFAKIPTVARVRCLKLELGQFTKKQLLLAPLAAARFENLEELCLAEVGESVTDWEAFVGALDAPRLRSVAMKGVRIASTTLATLAANARLTALDELHLDNIDRPLDRASNWKSSFAALAKHRPSLGALGLSGQRAGIEENDLLPLLGKASKGHVALERLWLWGIPVTDSFLDAAARSPIRASLRRLDLGFTQVTAAGIAQLLDAVPLVELSVYFPNAAEEPLLVDALLALPSTHPLRVVRSRHDVPAELRGRYSKS